MMLDEGHELHGHAAPLRTRLQPLPERSLPDECDPNVEAAEELRDRVDQGLEVLLRGQSPDVEDVLDRHRRMRRRTEEARVHAVRDEINLGGSDLPDLPAEFSQTEQFTRGVVGMARSQDPNSANSQFFIMFAPAPNLDAQYTIVGKVESGMELVDKIKKGDEADNGTVTDPDRMIKVRIAADGK